MLSVLEYLDRAGSSPFAAWSLPLGWVKPHAFRRRLQEARAQREAGGLRGVSQYERAWRVVRIGSGHLASVDFSRPISPRLQARVSDFRSVDAAAAAKVTTALRRLELGNVSNVKGVGSGVFEYRIDFGPGYRVYFGKDGDRLVILLGGGTKKRQQHDISAAIANWENYKRRK